MRPQPFECSITPRTPRIEATIKQEGRQALEDLEQYRGETKYRMSTFYAGDAKKGDHDVDRPIGAKE
jgi:hypothetical protein